MERKRSRPKPVGNKAVVFILLGVFASLAILIGGGVWAAWKFRVIQNRATEAELAAEREAERAEARAAFADPVPPTAEEEAEFGRFFERLQTALEGQNEFQLAGLINPERMAEELGRVGAFDKIPRGDRAGFRTGVVQGIRGSVGPALAKNELLRWNRTEIRRVRWSADRKEVAIIAVHRSVIAEAEMRLKMRWWLVRDAQYWRIYDLEDLDMGQRFSLTMRQMITPEFVNEMGTNPVRIQLATTAVREALAASVRKDVEEAERCLARCRGVKLPDPMAALREMVEGTVSLQRGDAPGALLHLEAAERLLPGMPVVKLLRAAALNSLSRFEEAMPLARGYVDELGPDATALSHLGYALERLQRPAEAADAYRTALDDDPDEVTCLHGLRRVLPVEKKAEIADRLARAKKPDVYFDELLNAARNEADDAGAKALLAWLRKAKPDDPRTATEELRDLVGAKKYAEAAAFLRKKLAAAKPEDKSQILNSYLFAMHGQKKGVEAYLAVPKEHAATAFLSLASVNEEELEGSDPEVVSPDEVQLKELIAAHRKADPTDPRLWFYEGTLLQAKREYEQAEKQFAEGMKRLKDRPEPDDTNDESGSTASFRYRRVDCLYSLKQGLKAYAEIGPAAATFRQLANRYDGDKDEAGLEALIAVHEKAVPKALEPTFWRAEVLYLKGQYREAAAGFQKYRGLANDKEPEWFRVTERILRSLIRANDAASARRAVIDLGDDNVWVVLRASVAAMGGNVAKVEQLMEEQSKTPGGLWSFYADEDFVRLIAGERFAEIRKKYPDPRPKTPAKVG